MPTAYGDERTQITDNLSCVVGYLPDYRIADWPLTLANQVTDLVYFSVDVPASGFVTPITIPATDAERLRSIQKTTKARVLVCVGGWGKSAGFPMVCASESSRSKLIAGLLQLCDENGLEGVDLDWEHPRGQQQLQGYADLVTEMKQRFAPRKLLVTVAQASWQDLGTQMYAAVDRIHLMSYDHPFPQATLAKSSEDIKKLRSFGCPSHKIVLGVPFYGRNEAGDAKSWKDLSTHSGFDSNQDIHQGFAANGRVTINKKLRLIRTHRLGGIMIWELGQDHPKEHSLLNFIHPRNENLSE